MVEIEILFKSVTIHDSDVHSFLHPFDFLTGTLRKFTPCLLGLLYGLLP